MQLIEREVVGDNIDLGFNTVQVEENNVQEIKPERVPFKSKLYNTSIKLWQFLYIKVYKKV